MNIIEIEHLKKYYGDVKAVDDISFSVRDGEFFAFLGVNGAGKSTTISVLCGTEKRTAGEVRIGGQDIDRQPDGAKRRLGVVFQESVLDRSLSVYDNLKYRAALYGLSGKAFEMRLRGISELFSLDEILKRRVGKLSGGQRRRVDIARALIHDPQTRRSVWQTVHALRKARNLTVFLTTHYMEEAADADRVVIIDAGRVMANDTPLGLKERYTGDFITLYHVREEEIAKMNVPYEKIGETFRIAVADPRQATELIVKYPAVFHDYEIAKGKMDDVFLAVTGKNIEGDNV